MIATSLIRIDEGGTACVSMIEEELVLELFSAINEGGVALVKSDSVSS